MNWKVGEASVDFNVNRFPVLLVTDLVAFLGSLLPVQNGSRIRFNSGGSS